MIVGVSPRSQYSLAILPTGQTWDYDTCTLQNHCYYSVGTELNQRLLRASLSGGEYQIVLFGIQRTRTSADSFSCISFALGMLVDLEYPALTFVECPSEYSLLSRNAS